MTLIVTLSSSLMCGEEHREFQCAVMSCRFNPMRVLLNNIRYSLMDNKLKGEELLRQSGVKYTIIRPGNLTNDPSGKEALKIGGHFMVPICKVQYLLSRLSNDRPLARVGVSNLNMGCFAVHCFEDCTSAHY